MNNVPLPPIFHSLLRLRLPNPTNLSEIEQRIHDYLYRADLPVIEVIQQTDGIYPYFLQFLNTELPPGLYAMDNQRFYTPIDTGHFGHHHLVSVPKEMVPLYGLTKYMYSKVHYTEKYIIIFVGCIGTNGRNRFISQIKDFTVYQRPTNDEYGIIPAPGVKPENELSHIFPVSANVQVANDTYNDSDSDTDEDDEFDDDPGFN